MELTLEKIKFKTKEENPCKIIFAVQIPQDLVNIKEEEVTLEFKKQAQLPGFRVGKAPVELVRKNYLEKVKSRTQDKLLSAFVPQILKEKEISPIVTPLASQIEYDGNNNLSFELIVERSPKFKVKNYKGIAVEKKIKKIKDEDVLKELENMRERNARLVPSSAKTLEKTHFAVIDYAAFLDGKEIPDLKYENQLIDCSAPQTVEGLAEAILGLKSGETKDVPFQFPKEYPRKELSGKSVTFKVVLREIKEKVLPAMDDEFSKDYGLKTLAELKEKMLATMQGWADTASQEQVEKAIFDKLILENPISVPESLVFLQLESLVDQALKREYGKAMEDASFRQSLEEQKKILREKFKNQAEKLVRLSYLIDGVGRSEHIETLEEDFKKDKENALEKNPELKAEIEKYYEENQQNILDQLHRHKIVKFLTDQAKIKEIQE
ncbi:MAG: trigger factor [Elusimicrobia bacterium RIFCSPLOWO2_02_FULL_39_32]|nr:MAG: trigger factor [Elusimicrobia bacterium RIFCSPHIGHO2_02_FULL_39_36]OGR91273.1 MAG: trigger factor [Elusimicrobia bacterium RIFCSPLOWO2_02_FULL_39_32]OGS00647.1 MAG: trigger factor [Elusimicrobia bacterium RIFCSPLOWO2_12_FULL_39_28]